MKSPEDFINSTEKPDDLNTELPTEVKELLEKITGLIKADNLALLKDLKGYPEFLDIPEIRKMGEELFLNGDDFKKVLEIAKIFKLSKSFLQESAINQISNGSKFTWAAILEMCHLDTDFINSERFQKVVQEKIISNLTESPRGLHDLDRQLKVFNVDKKAFQTEERKKQGFEILKNWVIKQGKDRISKLKKDDEKNGYYNQLTSSVLKEAIDLFGVENFFQDEEVHNLVLSNFIFFGAGWQEDEFISDESIRSFRDLFSITETEFQEVIDKRVTDYVKSISDFQFEKIPDQYDFNSFSSKVIFLGRFLDKYPVSPEILENISKLILSRGIEVFDEKILLNTKGESSYLFEYNHRGFIQYRKLIQLINKSFLSSYAKLPEFQEPAQKLVRHKILEFFQKRNSGWRDEVTKDIDEINNTFGLDKFKIEEEVFAEIIARDQYFTIDTIERFIQKIEEFASIDTQLKSNFILHAVTHTLDRLLADFDDSRGYNKFADFEKTCKKIKDLVSTYNLDQNAISHLVDDIGRSIDITHDAAERLLDIIAKQIGFSLEFRKELFSQELNRELDQVVSSYDQARRDALSLFSDDYESDIVYSANKFLKKYNLPEDTLTQMIIEAYEDLINQGEQIKAEKLVQKFGIVPEIIGIADQEEIKKRKIEKLKSLYLERNDFINAIKFIENNPDIQDAVKRELDYQQVYIEIANALEKSNTQYAFKLVKYLTRPGWGPSDMLMYHPDYERFFDTLSKQNPKLASKFLESFDSLFAMWPFVKKLEKSFGLISEKPFLAQALEENEKYGIKLLLKYPSLDKLSKANIDTLYQNKVDILEEQSDIDVDSYDFRVAMQNRLAEYRRNSEMLASMRKAGINTEEWLNYEDEVYFELGDSKSVNFSEMVSAPVERIHQNMLQYTEATKRVLKEYKKEFLGVAVPLKNGEEIDKKLQDLKEQLDIVKKSNDTKRIQYIEKAIANIEKEIENPRTITLWDKILSNLSSINILERDIFRAYTLLSESEVLLVEKQKDNSIPPDLKRKELLRLRNKIETSKKEIYDKKNLLLARLEKFNQDFIGTVSSAIGEERAIGLDQERREIVNELLDHFNTDFETLENLSKKQEEGTLDGRPMKISVWNRNPDVDLYLGNYTNCCIRIDSEHMGSESTIADYLTDTGVQIVNVYDEKEGIPVVTAWCWIGQDDNDKVSFVIDNIEANTQYSTKYKKQLEDELFKYMIRYSAKVGVPHFTQGQSNNDLIISRMDSKYYKIGGYNRASGYYLEGEGE